jgi:hypothetical protein
MSDKIILTAFNDGSMAAWRLKNLVEGQVSVLNWTALPLQSG